jgi:hypothetical protein
MCLTHDHVGTHLAQVVVRQAQPSQGRRAQVGHDDVARGDQPEHGLAPVCVLQVEAHVALVAQQVQGNPGHTVLGTFAHHPVGVTAGVLDADDIGAEIAQDLGGERPHHHRRDVDDANAGERAGGTCCAGTCCAGTCWVGTCWIGTCWVGHAQSLSECALEGAVFR